jgi:hypothetical protein
MNKINILPCNFCLSPRNNIYKKTNNKTQNCFRSSVRTQSLGNSRLGSNEILKRKAIQRDPVFLSTINKKNGFFIFTSPPVPQIKPDRFIQTHATKRDNSYIDKDKVVSITYEEIGLFPRSFSRVLDRFLKQLFSDVDTLVIQEYRFYRYLFLTTIKTIFILLFVPFVVNFIAKNYVVKPITEYFWNTSHPEIFLNSYEQKRAFAELEKFEEKIYFEALVESLQKSHTASSGISQYANEREHSSMSELKTLGNRNNLAQESTPDTNVLEQKLSLLPSNTNIKIQGAFPRLNLPSQQTISTQSPESSMQEFVSNSLMPEKVLESQGAAFLETQASSLSRQNSLANSVEGSNTNATYSIAHTQSYYIRKNKDIKKLYQEKALELALYYNNHSIEAWTNFFADLLSLCTLLYLLITLEIQINITKSFLLEVFFGLDDSKKSLLILLVTDLLVGYHSSNLWELFFEFIFNHYGIPESQTGIFLLVATLPVLLDVLFKYLIFRHLNRSSPATVATYQAIIE